MRQMILDFPVRNPCAIMLGLKLTSSTNFRTFSVSASLILFSFAFPFKMKDTVVMDIPNSRPMSRMESFLLVLLAGIITIIDRIKMKIHQNHLIPMNFHLSYFYIKNSESNIHNH